MSDPQELSQDLAELTELARRFSEREMYEEAADLFLLAPVSTQNPGVKLGPHEVRKLQRRQKGGPAHGR